MSFLSIITAEPTVQPITRTKLVEQWPSHGPKPIRWWNCRLHASQTTRNQSSLKLSTIFGPAEAFNIITCKASSGEFMTEKGSLLSWESPSALHMEDIICGKHRNRCEELCGLLLKVEDPLESMALIDALQRLCIDHHFEEEIRTVLSVLYTRFGSDIYQMGTGSLHDVSLCFRLFRQAGYCVPTDVFDKFRDNRGRFKPELNEDTRGMLSLFEASHLGIHGEDILDEANELAYKHLSASRLNLSPPLARAVEDTLKHPFNKSLASFKVKSYLKNFSSSYWWHNSLQELAKVEFNLVQSLHRQEVAQVSQWWRDLGLSDELKFARNQPLKWYMWSMVVLRDPRFSEQRIDLTKPIALIYIIDDIFDVYGTLDELVIFTEVINKWELVAAEQLPKYMRKCFKALYGITNEICTKVFKETGWNPINSLQKAWASLCNAFLVEAKWFSSRQLPNETDYLKNGIVSSGVHVALIHIFFLLGQGITKESVDYLDAAPAIISSSASILRLWDDLGSAKDENQEGYDGSYIECYMKNHQGISIEGARNHVLGMISDSWKQLNQECLSPNPFSPTFIEAIHNFAKMVSVMYDYDDYRRLPVLEEYINSLLFENIPLRG
ncbi:PREDICTED: (3S,6E)-nerolidol synthase 1-like [Nelumbo nucifera]|uniref:(3S,6E)-nerolidol synthase 1-like n=1 Tax=Nelumbo nucifera TaxID=4432 RepID=A0A1U7Z4L4_NELNU|nr:PREDICTED: (3S,6E)-nerolidol synthase 1-like [Nelumbo nucifera]XP_010248191.1 PREDICTED: (3S,6E)-nerolidol synthase 1-like [Nelumbo nucifera]